MAIRRYHRRHYEAQLLELKTSIRKNLQTKAFTLILGQRQNKKLYKRYLLAWDSYKPKDGNLYKKAAFPEQLVLRSTLADTVFKAYHNDLRHQGRERTLLLIRRQFLWPGMNGDIKNRSKTCGRCIRRETAPTKATQLVNITSQWCCLTDQGSPSVIQHIVSVESSSLLLHSYLT